MTKRKIVIEVLGDPVKGLLGKTLDRVAAVSGEALEGLEEFQDVRVIIRCGKCGRIVSRNGITWSNQRGRFSCKDHGPIAGEITVGELHAEWTRRGKPEAFTIKRNPVD